MTACKEITPELHPCVQHGLERSQYYCCIHMMQDKINRLIHFTMVCVKSTDNVPYQRDFSINYVHLILVIFCNVLNFVVVLLPVLCVFNVFSSVELLRQLCVQYCVHLPACEHQKLFDPYRSCKSRHIHTCTQTIAIIWN